MRPCLPPSLRFTTLESAEKWMKSCEAGKPDWSLPVPPVMIGIHRDGRREFKINPDFEAAQFEAIWLLAEGSLGSTEDMAPLAYAEGPREGGDGHTAPTP